MPRKSSIIPVPSAKKEIVPVPTSKPSFLNTIKDGIAYGIGNAIAHRMVGGALNGGGTPIANRTIEYEECLKESTKEDCERYAELLKGKSVFH